jgi:hypothetical protein
MTSFCLLLLSVFILVFLGAYNASIGYLLGISVFFFFFDEGAHSYKFSS